MYQVSQQFLDAVYAPSRHIAARVTYAITDVTAYGDVSNITVSGEAAGISDKSQLVNRARRLSHNYSTFETDRFKLDGSFSFADDTLANNGEMGYVSDVLSNADGTFSSYPTITIQFNGTHSSGALTVTFDDVNGEYATDYDIAAYDASNALITSVSVTGNTDIIDEPLGQLSNYKKIIITIKKWCKGNRRARLLEVDFGIVKVYTADNMVSLSLVEDLYLDSANIPSAEVKFEVDNSDRAFNILNPTGFYKYLQQRQTVTVEMGPDVGGGFISYIPLGTYYLAEWVSNEGSLTATFTARNALDLMTGYSYENLTASSKSLTQLATTLFSTCGITKYSIDPSLNSIMTNGLVKKASCRDVLQMVAIAGCANVYVTRDDVIHIKSVGVGTAADTVTQDNAYAEPQIALDKVVKQVDVRYWTDFNTSTVVSAVDSSVTTGGDTFKVDNVTLIDTSARATAVANWILNQKKNRAKYTINWRGNPAHELADTIGIETSYGTNLNAAVVHTELTYKGYLTAKTEARGVPN